MYCCFFSTCISILCYEGMKLTAVLRALMKFSAFLVRGIMCYSVLYIYAMYRNCLLLHFVCITTGKFQKFNDNFIHYNWFIKLKN